MSATDIKRQLETLQLHTKAVEQQLEHALRQLAERDAQIAEMKRLAWSAIDNGRATMAAVEELQRVSSGCQKPKMG